MMEIFKDEMFYTPLGSPKKEGTSFTTMPCPKAHLQVDTYLHFAIVKQLTKLIVISTLKIQSLKILQVPSQHQSD